MTTTKPMTINSIIKAARAAGSHWFDHDTMRHFNCVLSGHVFSGDGGIYFVSSERFNDDTPRKYTVRQFTPDAPTMINDAGGFQAYSTESEATAQAQRLARGDGPAPVETTERAKLPTVSDDWLACLRSHVNPKVTRDDADSLRRLATRHLKLQEDACNFEVPENHDAKCEARITRLAVSIGCKGVVFQGDPRGCTVRLVSPDGYESYSGADGICVPTMRR